MRWKAWVAIVLIAAGLGDGVALSARAWCAPARGQAMSQASCCCGSHACSTSTPKGLGMRSGCCDMRRLPVRDAETSSAAREGVPVPGGLPLAALGFLSPAPSVPDSSPVWRLPDSLHAPPLYDLFRSYRI